jgi:hypothetical protein
LPLAERVAFRSARFAEDDRRRGPWDWAAVEKVAGHLMERREGTPARVLVRDFPGDQLLDEIARLSSPPE